jgi:hypothetical protein
VVAGGQIRLQVGEEEICVRPGTVAAVGPHVLHCARSFSTDFSGVYVLVVCGLPLDFEGFDSAILELFGYQFLQDARYYEDFVALCDRLLGTGEDAAKIESYVVWLHLLLTNKDKIVRAKRSHDLILAALVHHRFHGSLSAAAIHVGGGAANAFG